jgi:hypothetical protein
MRVAARAAVASCQKAEDVRRPSLTRASLCPSSISTDMPSVQTTRSEFVQIEVAHSVMSMLRIPTQRPAFKEGIGSQTV